jgi:hypothetical protein
MAQKRKHNGDDLPLDDPRWLPLINLYNELSEQLTGKPDSPLARMELLERLRTGELRWMRRSIKDPSQRERGHPSFFQDRLITAIGADSRIYPGEKGYIFWAYYVWKPDRGGLWQSPDTNQRKVDPPSRRRKPGPPPTHEWPLVVAAEVIRRIKAGKKDPTATAMIKYCENTLPDEFSPGLKEMQLLLKKLLLGQF